MAELPSAQQRAEERRRDFERQVVIQILTHTGMLYLLSEWKAALVQQRRDDRLTLAYFYERYPQFPIRLGAVLLPDRSHVEWTDFFNRFTRTAYFRAYQRWREEHNLNDVRDPLGIVFNSPHVTTVLHTWNGRRAPGTTRLVRTLGRPSVTFTLETLASMLRAIGPDWANNNKLETT